jgi:hypothetical protein
MVLSGKYCDDIPENDTDPLEHKILTSEDESSEGEKEDSEKPENVNKPLNMCNLFTSVTSNPSRALFKKAIECGQSRECAKNFSGSSILGAEPNKEETPPQDLPPASSSLRPQVHLIRGEYEDQKKTNKIRLQAYYANDKLSNLLVWGLADSTFQVARVFICGIFNNNSCVATGGESFSFIDQMNGSTFEYRDNINSARVKFTAVRD